MSKYRVGQRVNVRIERVLPFGVFARLEDGARAYIRPRELDLDADIDPTQAAHPGHERNAVIIKLEEGQKHLELSYRAILDDPWKSYSGQHKEGDVIRGTVRANENRRSIDTYTWRGNYSKPVLACLEI